jgi:hypothetical protein
MLNKQKAIDDIIKNFNWEKVQKTMYALKWTWYDSEDETPTLGALFRCALKLLHDTYDMAEKMKANCSTATGGFYARAFVDEQTKEIYELRLSFEICNWEYNEELD